MKSKKTTAPARSRGPYAVALLAVVLIVLFWRSFVPGYVHFNNDGPLGQQNSAWLRLPAAITGMWDDLNYIGLGVGSYTLNVSALLHLIFNPVNVAKFYPIIPLFMLGLGALTLFRQLKLSWLAATLGALAAMLNSTFFSAACWGVASQEIAISMDFFALALIVGCNSTTPALVAWSRLALAGLCVGMNVMEGADIGALFSVLVAMFAVFHALSESEGTLVRKSLRGISRVAVVAVFAVFISIQAVVGLVGTSVQGLAGTQQTAEARAAHWDWATQWSLPKAETLGLIVPGLFGYKMDTPKDMMPVFHDAYDDGNYWGGSGRAPELDRYFDNPSQGPQPSGPNIFMRFSGGGNYCGILVLLIAGWAIAQAFRRQDSIFPNPQKRQICFWAVIMFFCLLLAWGRFAPFYYFLYQLPYFSTIRNPAKFIIFFGWALTIVFALGVNALDRNYLNAEPARAAGSWWSSSFNRKWTYASAAMLVASVLGWLVYVGEKSDLVAYLKKVGFADQDGTFAPAIAAFSFAQVEWFLVLFAVALGLVLLIITGIFNGPRAKIGAFLLGAFMIFDLGRANLPWVTHWNYKYKYEVGSLNPVLQFLADQPYEHRVVVLPDPQMQLRGYDNAFGGSGVYRIEWAQHHFPYYNIQSFDMIQMARMPEDIRAFKEAVESRGALEWQLTNTRYLLGAAGWLDSLNQQLDPAQRRFRIALRFDLVPKPGVAQPSGLEDLTAVTNSDGGLAVFDFTGALPRAKVYSNWQTNNPADLKNFTTNGLDPLNMDVFQGVGTNDFLTLKQLTSPDFDPRQTVLVSGALPAAPAGPAGAVEYQSYEPKHIVLSAKTTVPSVLLLNDRYDKDWRVTVDGKPAPLLRCNYIMRGVYLPDPGQHTVDFFYRLPNRPLYVTIAAFIAGLALCGYLFITRNRNPSQA